MTITNYTELMPKWLGEPMYPAGLPVKLEDYSFEGRTLREIWMGLVDQRLNNTAPDGNPNNMSEDEKILVAYVLYYINAPVFDSEFTNELRATAGDCENLDDLIMHCLEYGLDPF